MNEYKNIGRGHGSTTYFVFRYSYIEISVQDLRDSQENKKNEITILSFFFSALC